MKSIKLYLFAYNVVQFFGWAYILFKTVCGLSERLTWSQLYTSVEPELKLFQTLAIMEVVHAMLGVVHSPVETTIMQVASRITLVWPVLHTCSTVSSVCTSDPHLKMNVAVMFTVVGLMKYMPTWNHTLWAWNARTSVGVPMLLIAWSVTEVVRYSYYALALFEAVPYFLKWMRYTFFIVLYPLGVTGELLTLIGSLPEIAEKKYYTYEMPNALNIGFSFYCVLIGLALLYIPGFPQLYLYMFSQRKKILIIDAAKKRQ